MNTLQDLITAITDPKFDPGSPVRVMIYGVAQKSIIRVETINEGDGPKVVLYLEELAESDRDEKIRALSG